jgi:hypothetical protein
VPGSPPGKASTRQAGVAVALCLLASLASLPPQAAAAQDRSKSTEPEQLWKAYPLDPTVSPSAQPVVASPPARAQPDRRPVAVSRPDSGGGTRVVVLVLLALFAAGAAMAFLGIRRRRKPEPAVLLAPRLVRTAPVLPPRRHGRSGRFTPATPRPSRTLPAIARASAQNPGPRKPRAGGEVPAPVAAASPTNPAHRDSSQLTPAAAVAAASPPERTRAWTAEIEWRQPDAEGVFRVVARPTEGRGEATIAESARLEWPPKGPASVEKLRQAVEQLEASLLAAAWEPLPSGGSWYAKRFAWEARQPAEAPASAEPLAPADSAEPPEARQPQRSGRFERSQTWPADTLDLWRCEIKWDAGYVNSSFKVLAYPPGKKRGRTIGESATFKWMIMEPPDPRGRATLAEVRRLGSALAAAGWQRVEHGPNWYSERYAWRREEPPPDHVDPAPVEGERAS